MKLTADECITILKQQPNPDIAKAVYHENRIRLHAEPTLTVPRNPAYTDFLGKVKKRIPNDAYDRFTSLIEFPFVTVDFIEGVFSGFQRVFECPDRYVSFSFTNPDYDSEFKEEIHETEEFFKKNGLTILKTKFNSFIVVDLPPVQETPRPKPYQYCLPISRVEQVKVNRKNKVEYIAFDTGEKNGENRLIAFFEDTCYRVYVEKDKGSSYVLFSESIHNLGFCPVAPFWTDPLDATESMVDKISPATNSLGSLDTLAFKEISKQYSDLYNLYPILATYEEEEDQESIQEDMRNTGDWGECVDGPIVFNQSNANKIWTNPGRHIIKPIPRDDQPALGAPAEFISPKVDNLKFIKEDLESQRLTIHYSIAGKPGEPTKDQAINEKQVSAGFESEQAILLNLSSNFEEIEEFVLKTKAALMFGLSSIKKESVNYGKNYFLHNHVNVMEEMEMAKKVGMPSYIIDQLNRSFISTKYRSNPDQNERMQIIRMLFPYPNLTDSEVIKNASLLDPIKVAMRLDFFDLLDTFERTYSKVESLMDGTLDMETRVEMIKDEFINLVNKGNIYGNIRKAQGTQSDVSEANGQKAGADMG